MRAMEPVVAPAIAAIRREVALADAELTSVVGIDEVMVVEEPPTTVTIVVITNDSGAETDSEVD